MRNLILFGLLVLLLLAAQFVSAKTIDEVIEKYIRALGGRDKLTSIKSFYMEGVRKMMDKETIIKILRKQGVLNRTEIENGKANDFVITTVEEARTSFPPGSPAAEKFTGEVLTVLHTVTDIAGPLVDYIAKGHKAELLGKEIAGGNNCYKIKLTTRENREILFWLDTATCLVHQSSFNPFSDSGETGEKFLTMYSDYKEVGGVRFAHAYQIKTTGSHAAGMAEEFFFHKIIINPPVDTKVYLPQ